MFTSSHQSDVISTVRYDSIAVHDQIVQIVREIVDEKTIYSKTSYKLTNIIFLASNPIDFKMCLLNSSTPFNSNSGAISWNRNCGQLRTLSKYSLRIDLSHISSKKSYWL